MEEDCCSEQRAYVLRGGIRCSQPQEWRQRTTGRPTSILHANSEAINTDLPPEERWTLSTWVKAIQQGN
eukprot:10989394-Karenia_brevis.AAC.1